MLTVKINADWFRSVHAVCNAVDDTVLNEMRELIEEGLSHELRQQALAPIQRSLDGACDQFITDAFAAFKAALDIKVDMGTIVEDVLRDNDWRGWVALLWKHWGIDADLPAAADQVEELGDLAGPVGDVQALYTALVEA